jgi:CheY-like chemotaxis protein
VEADSGQLQQLTMNLVINGAEAIGGQARGTVVVTTRVERLSASQVRGEFATEGLEAGAHVVLEVCDTGCGMDPETLARVFDPFFTTKFTGRGLGLAAALGIVRGHRGAIRVTSAPGQGSTFRVYLPAVPQPAMQEAAMPECVSGGRTGTILVVDDEESVRSAVKNTLSRCGYELLLAGNGQEAVEIFRREAERITLVLLDLTMPQMGGEETLQHMKKLRPDVPVILSSGYDEAEALARFGSNGLAGFLQKPYTASRLAAGINAVVDAAAGSPGA